MNALFLNKSGYVDKTAGKALSRIVRDEEKALLSEMKSRPRVYVVSAFEDEEISFYRLCRYCRYVISQNAIPVSSHLMYWTLLKDRDKRTMTEQFGLSLLSTCDEIWVFNQNRELTTSMREQIREARILGKRVKYHDVKELGL